MNNVVLAKTMENLEKHRDIKLVTSERKRNCHTTKALTENILAIEMKKKKQKKKTEMLMNEPVHLGLSILE